MGTVRIPLHSRKYPGLFALVDEADAELVSGYKWHPQVAPSGTRKYALAYIYGQGPTRSISMHRIIMGAKKGEYVDHINHDGLDNRRANLRICTNGQNMQNRKSLCAMNSSGYTGVRLYESGRWAAYVIADGKWISGGTFATAEEAAVARDALALKHHGEFASLNFPMARHRQG